MKPTHAQKTEIGSAATPCRLPRSQRALEAVLRSFYWATTFSVVGVRWQDTRLGKRDTWWPKTGGSANLPTWEFLRSAARFHAMYGRSEIAFDGYAASDTLNACARLHAAPLLDVQGETVGYVYAARMSAALATPKEHALLDACGRWVETVLGHEAPAGAASPRDPSRNDPARLTTIMEATQAGTWEWNLQTREVAVNDRWAMMLGVTRAELAGRDLHGGRGEMHPDDLTEANEKLDAHLRGETDYYDMEARVKHRDGRWIWIRSRGRLVSRSAQGSPQWMYGTHVDVTARKEAEERLRASEAFLDRTGKMAGVGGWEVDLESGVVRWTDETCRIHGRQPGYVPTIEDSIGYFDEPSRAVLRGELDAALEGSTGWDVELPLTQHGGTTLWVRVVGHVEKEGSRPRRLIGAIQDITPRKVATAALELSERRYRKLFHSSMGLICTHDLDGGILSVNPAVAGALGYTSSQLVGRGLMEFMLPRLRPDFNAYLARMRANGRDSGVLQLTARDGPQLVWQYDNVLDEEDQGPYVLAHAQDITARQRNERRLLEWSVRDPLTGCFNRRYLSELGQSLSSTDAFGVIAIDLDHFKRINDTHGHERGDRVLIATGRFLTAAAGSEAAVVRMGGDEFVIVLKAAHNEAVRRLVQILETQRNRAPTAFTMGYSVRSRGKSLAEVAKAADKALYQVRHSARAEQARDKRDPAR